MEKSKIVASKRFVGKVAIVIGSTRGIGFSIAERLGLEGASVVVSSRKQQNVDEAVKKLKEQGIEVLGVACHVSNAQQRKNLLDTTLQKFGKIDVIVSNAAVNPIVDWTTNTILQVDESVLEKLWEINVKACILFLKEAAPHLRRGSSIVLISSIVAYCCSFRSSAMYSVTKTALLGLTKALANELATKDNRVNCVAPGIIPTRFADIITKNKPMMEVINRKILLQRLGTPEEIAAATAFLASTEASYITGETLVVAGGLPSRL